MIITTNHSLVAGSSEFAQKKSQDSKKKVGYFGNVVPKLEKSQAFLIDKFTNVITELYVGSRFA